MNRQLRSLIAAVLGLALAMPAAAQPQESPFPASSGLYGATVPAHAATGGPDLSIGVSPFPTSSGLYGAAIPSQPSPPDSAPPGFRFSAPPAPSRGISGGFIVNVATIHPALLLIALPVAVLVPALE